MYRFLFSPKWLLGQILVIVAIAAFLALGWWQWGRAQFTGNPQNLGYAIQWPVFAGCAVALWVYSIRQHAHRGDKAGTNSTVVARVEKNSPTVYSRDGSLPPSYANPRNRSLPEVMP